MSDKIQKPAEEDFSLESILKEVDSWSSPTGTSPASETQAAPMQAPKEVQAAAPVDEPAEPEVATPKPSKRQLPAQTVRFPAQKLKGKAQEDEAEGEAAHAAPIPDNLITFTPPEDAPILEKTKLEPVPEPDTILEAAQLGASKLKVWAEEKRESFTPPKIRRKSAPEALPRAEKKAPPRPTAPDTPPKELAARYAKDMKALLRRKRLAFLGLLLLFVLAIIPSISILPEAMRAAKPLLWVNLAVFALSLFAAAPLWIGGIIKLLRGKPDMTTLAAFSALFVMADGLFLQLLALRSYSLPLFLPAALLLFCTVDGAHRRAFALRLTCRTAAAAAAPDLMTAEPSQWNGKSVYRRRFGGIAGFGSQVQEPDGASLRFARAAPFLLALALVAGLAPQLMLKQPQLILWALSASFTVAATLSAAFCFSLPFHRLARRLAKMGVALAGWRGICEARAGSGLLVEASDLFPPGSVKLVSHRSFGEHKPSYMVSVTASLIRAAGGGLDPLFYTLMRDEGGSFLTATDLDLENEGISARVAGEPVLVGNLSYLAERGINIPLGVRVKTGMFTAIGGSFAGQFVLEYSMHKHAATAMDALRSSRVTPILIGVDFNLVPSILEKLFRFPWSKMAFPETEQRAKLQKAPPPRETTLVGLLCLQGLAPVAVAAAGAQRLRTAVRLSTSICLVGAVLGIAICTYLTAAAAFTSLTAIGLSLFMLSWLLPTLLISAWVDMF